MGDVIFNRVIAGAKQLLENMKYYVFQCFHFVNLLYSYNPKNQ